MAAAPAAMKMGEEEESNELTREHFVNHGKAMRVCNIQEQFEKLVHSQKSAGIKIEEQLKKQGHKNWNSFILSCPKFSLFCWPSELAQLGSGVVLYFHFLAFCGTFLFFAFLVQMPAVLEYNAVGNITAWNYNPGGFDTTDIDNCKCTGTNGGYTGPNGDTEYGTKCKAWDLDACKTTVVSANLGRWCCREWCFASKKCPSTQNWKNPSLSNRFNVESDLVRSYHACEQPPTTQCTEDMANDTAYPFDKYDESHSVSNDLMTWYGPGNLGPDAGSAQIVLLVYVIVIIFFHLALILMNQYQLRVISEVDGKTTTASDFAIMVSNLPLTMTSETELKAFFKKNAVDDSEDTEIVKVVIGWDSEDFRRLTQKLNRLKRKLMISVILNDLPACCKCLKCFASPLEDLMRDMGKITKEMNDSAKEMGQKLNGSGVAFVVFRWQLDQRKCLEKWNQPACKSSKSALPKLHWLVPKVRHAPEAFDVNWVDLGVLKKERYERAAKTNACMLLVLIVSFGVVYGVRLFGMSIIFIMGANVGIRLIAYYIAEEEYWDTYTEQDTSVSIKLTLSLIVNYAFVFFFQCAQPKEWYRFDGLVGGITMLVGFSGVIGPLMLLWDSKYSIKGITTRNEYKCYCGLCQCRCLPCKEFEPYPTDEVLAEWNEVLKTKNQKGLDKNQQTDLHQVGKQIKKMEQSFETTELDMQKRYVYAVRTFIICLIYSPLIPLLCLVGIIALTVQYWIDKYLLVRWARRPDQPYPGGQAVLSVQCIKYICAPMLPVAAFVFIHPSWKTIGDCVAFMCIGLAISIGFCLVPSSWCTFLLDCIPGLGRKNVKTLVADSDNANHDYYKAQYLWPIEMKYHKSQFLYKLLPEKMNPENLSPDTSDATDDDIRRAMATGATEAATAAVDGSGSGAAVSVPGHGVHKIGSSTAPAALHGDAGDFKKDDSEPSGSPQTLDDAPVAEVVAEVVTPVAVPVWQFQTRSGKWYDYDLDNNEHIEYKYQQQVKSGKDSAQWRRITIHTSVGNVTLDFHKMTQKTKHGKPTAIRRNSGE